MEKKSRRLEEDRDCRIEKSLEVLLLHVRLSLKSPRVIVCQCLFLASESQSVIVFCVEVDSFGWFDGR